MYCLCLNWAMNAKSFKNLVVKYICYWLQKDGKVAAKRMSELAN